MIGWQWAYHIMTAGKCHGYITLVKCSLLNILPTTKLMLPEISIFYDQLGAEVRVLAYYSSGHGFDRRTVQNLCAWRCLLFGSGLFYVWHLKKKKLFIRHVRTTAWQVSTNCQIFAINSVLYGDKNKVESLLIKLDSFV
jgi:hypothetical protein